MQRARLQARLKAQCQQTTDSGCWIWQGQLSNSGHGRLKIKDDDGHVRMVSAEDASYKAFLGALPAKHYAVQRCGNRLCINPEHLQLKEFG